MYTLYRQFNLEWISTIDLRDFYFWISKICQSFYDHLITVQGVAVSGLTIPSPYETILSSYKYSHVWMKWVTILWLVTHHPKVGGCSSVTQMNAYMMKELSNQSSLWSNLRPQPPGQKTFLHSCNLASSDLLIFWSIFHFPIMAMAAMAIPIPMIEFSRKKNFIYPYPGGVRV